MAACSLRPAEGGALLLDAATRRVQRDLRFGSADVTALALSNGAVWLAYAGADGTLRLQDTRGASTLAWRVEGLGSPVGKYLVSGHGDGSTRLWDAILGSPIGDSHE